MVSEQTGRHFTVALSCPIYFARPRGSTEIHAVYNEDSVGWYGPENWREVRVNAEVTGWCERALTALEGYGSEQSRR
jgi:hypothetical protein